MLSDHNLKAKKENFVRILFPPSVHCAVFQKKSQEAILLIFSENFEEEAEFLASIHSRWHLAGTLPLAPPE